MQLLSFAFTILTLCATYCHASDPVEYPIAVDWVGMNPYAGFGTTAAAYGDEIIIGTSNTTSSQGNSYGYGYVSVYKRTANGDFPTVPAWTYGNLQQNASRFILHMGTKGFGNSVAITANHVGIGAVANNQAFAIRRDGKGQWPSDTQFMQLLVQNPDDTFGGLPSSNSYSVKVTPDMTGLNDFYGCQVSLGGDTIAVSACRYNSKQGAVYLYTTKKVLGSELEFNTAPVAVLTGTTQAQAFGTATSMTSNYIAVGAPYAPSNDHAGEVLLFGRSASENIWMTEPLSISGSTVLKGNRPHGRFGSSISLTEKSLLVGDYVEYLCSTGTSGSQPNCETTASDFGGEVSIWNYNKKDEHIIELYGNVVILGDRAKQSFGVSVSLGEGGTRFVVGGNDDTAWVYGTDDNGIWSSELKATQVGDGGGYGRAVVAGKDYILVTAPERYGTELSSINNGQVYIYRIFEASPLSITIIFGISVVSLTLVCFVGLYLRFYCAESGDAKVIDPKLAAKAARLGFDHHNVGHKDFARRKGEQAKEKKFLAPAGANVTKQERLPTGTVVTSSSNPMGTGTMMVGDSNYGDDL